jgi:DNA-binding MarR family transcriptional regulator
MTQATGTGVEELAHELWSVLGPLLRRVLACKSMPFAQLAVLSRLERDGASTTSELATQERVRPQSMAATVAELQERGLVDRAPDPLDGRKILIRLTEAGARTLGRERAASQEWLRLALAERLGSAEQAELGRALRLIERLATQ